MALVMLTRIEGKLCHAETAFVRVQEIYCEYTAAPPRDWGCTAPRPGDTTVLLLPAAATEVVDEVGAPALATDVDREPACLEVPPPPALILIPAPADEDDATFDALGFARLAVLVIPARRFLWSRPPAFCLFAAGVCWTTARVEALLMLLDGSFFAGALALFEEEEAAVVILRKNPPSPYRKVTPL